MTEDAVLSSGIRFSKSQNVFTIPGNQAYCLPNGLAAEGDWSGAAFFLCAGALSDTGIFTSGLQETSRQADRAVLELLSRFGAEVRAETGGVFVRKAALHGIDIDAGAIPDLIPPSRLSQPTRRAKRISRTRQGCGSRSPTGCIRLLKQSNPLAGRQRSFPTGSSLPEPPASRAERLIPSAITGSRCSPLFLPAGAGSR